MSDVSLPNHLKMLFERVAASGQDRIIKAWAELFGAEYNDATVLEVVGNIAADLDRLLKAVEASKHGDALKGVALENLRRVRQFAVFPKLYEAGPPNLRTPDIKAAIDSLALLDAVIPSALNRALPATTIDEFKKEVGRLIEEANDLDTPVQVKLLISEHLTRLLWALTSYELLGLEAVSRIYGATSAELLRMTPELVKTEKGKGFLASSIKTIRNIGAAIVLVGGLDQGAHTLTNAVSAAAALLPPADDAATAPTHHGHDQPDVIEATPPKEVRGKGGSKEPAA